MYHRNTRFMKVYLKSKSSSFYERIEKRFNNTSSFLDRSRIFWSEQKKNLNTGTGLGVDALSLGIRRLPPPHPCGPKISSPLCTILRYLCLADGL